MHFSSKLQEQATTTKKRKTTIYNNNNHIFHLSLFFFDHIYNYHYYNYYYYNDLYISIYVEKKALKPHIHTRQFSLILNFDR